MQVADEKQDINKCWPNVFLYNLKAPSVLDKLIKTTKMTFLLGVLVKISCFCSKKYMHIICYRNEQSEMRFLISLTFAFCSSISTSAKCYYYGYQLNINICVLGSTSS